MPLPAYQGVIFKRGLMTPQLMADQPLHLKSSGLGEWTPVCRHIWLTSKQHLSVHFNPSALLSFGDLLAFANAVSGPMSNQEAAGGSLDGVSNARMAAPEAPPHMRDQMAQRGSIISRVPQKYLIQNQSGLRVYYWASAVSHQL